MKELFSLILCVFCFNAYANNCGGEFQPETGTCRIIGPDGRQILYNSAPPQSANPTPPAKIIRYTEVKVPSKYGALAFNSKKGAIGGFINANSKTEAQRKAIQRCEQGGKYAPCKIIASVRNGCIAAVSGKSKSGTNKIFRAIEERGVAEKVALNECNSSGYNNCEIVMPEGCSIPDTSQY